MLGFIALDKSSTDAFKSVSVDTTATVAPATEESTKAVSEVTEAIASASEAPAYADTEQPVADAIDHVTASAEAKPAE